MQNGQDWRPGAAMRALRLRAEMLANTRRFFAERHVMEVETPTLSPASISDSNLHSFQTLWRGPGPLNGQPLYLHTSPEFAMKRLLAAGSGPIYQICKVFRDEELGRRHNPEFTLLEWYRPAFDHFELMIEVDTLVRTLLEDVVELGPTQSVSYQELFLNELGIDPFNTSVSQLSACASRNQIGTSGNMPSDALDPWLDLLLTHLIEPQLGSGHPCFLHGYPSSQAALARVSSGDPAMAERFELYINGTELANGFHELVDANEQRRRFELDNQARSEAGLALVPLDERFLAALLSGMPECSGVALGFDRLLMLAAGANSLDEVLSFSLDRA